MGQGQSGGRPKQPKAKNIKNFTDVNTKDYHNGDLSFPKFKQLKYMLNKDAKIDPSCFNNCKGAPVVSKERKKEREKRVKGKDAKPCSG